MPEITLTLDPRVYSLDVVKKAAYRLGDRCSSNLELTPEGGIRVTLTAKSAQASVDTIAGDFRNELLDQDLRKSIADETERVRNLLLAQAFSGLSLTGEAADSADYRDDPLGIGRSQVETH